MPPSGQRFSQVYARRESNLPDSKKARRRMALLFSEKFHENENDLVGHRFEAEIGVQIAQQNFYGTAINWREVFDNLILHDLLDGITVLAQFAAERRNMGQRDLLEKLRRILAEEQISYRIDDDFGVHPQVDAVFLTEYQSALRSLAAANMLAAKAHVERAEKLLIDPNQYREAVRACFDAVENVFKIHFPRAPQLNSTNVNQHLKAMLDARYGKDRPALLASQRLLASLSGWADACHNYRHEPGQPEPTNPPEELAVLLISQGFSFVRWLADLLPRIPSLANPSS